MNGSYAIQCVHCSHVVDSKISDNKSVDLMMKHVQKEHPSKNQFL